LFRSNDKALIDELGRAGEKPICSKSFTSTIRCRGFFRSFAEAADFSDFLPNSHIFAAQISVRQNRHCRNLDAELIDFSKRNEKLRHLI
jgi:predicted Zn-dependent protease